MCNCLFLLLNLLRIKTMLHYNNSNNQTTLIFILISFHNLIKIRKLIPSNVLLA